MFKSVLTTLLTLSLYTLFAAGCSERGPLQAGTTLLTPTAALPGEAVKQKTSNQKFTFTGVTLSDSTITVENGIIEAGSRDAKHDKSDLTNCSYFTEGYQESLGYYAENVAFRSAEAVKAFCIEHFADRFE